MQKRECNSQSYERNALLTFMNPCLIITAVTAGHWLGVGKICTTPAYESFIWMLFGLLWNMIQNMMLYYTIHKIRATLFTSPPPSTPIRAMHSWTDHITIIEFFDCKWKRFQQLSLFIVYNFIFGTEVLIYQKKFKGWLVGVWEGLSLDRSKLSWELFGLIQTFFIFIQTPSKQEV